jgi:hypothetical protein
VTAFISVCLVVFAGCAGLGILPPSVLAAKARKPAMAVIALLVAAFVIYVLVTASVELPRG